MGYDLHITRKRNWMDEDGPSITLEEWLALVTADSSLLHARTSKGVVEHLPSYRASEGLVYWTPPGQQPPGEQWFDWQDGNLTTGRQADTEAIRKMWVIAQVLNARVVGDDGEEYQSDGRTWVDIDGRTFTEGTVADWVKPWWKFW